MVGRVPSPNTGIDCFFYAPIAQMATSISLLRRLSGVRVLVGALRKKVTMTDISFVDTLAVLVGPVVLALGILGVIMYLSVRLGDDD